MQILKTMVTNFKENIGYKSEDDGFIRVKIVNLDTPGPKTVKVNFVDSHKQDDRNMIDISGDVPQILNYTKNVRTLQGKQEEILDPVQIKFMALWCAKNWTIDTIRQKLGYSYRQARYIKQYQKIMISKNPQESANHYLDLCFAGREVEKC